MAAFSKGHRADIRRAERDGVVIRVGAPEADADVLHQMLVATNTRKSFGFHSAGYYRRLLHDFGDAARLQIAELNGEPIGASLILAFGAARDIPRRRLERCRSRASRGASAAVARHPLGQGARRLNWDLWGIADARGRYELAAAAGSSSARLTLAKMEAAAKSDPLDGVYRFKKGWGGRSCAPLPGVRSGCSSRLPTGIGSGGAAEQCHLVPHSGRIREPLRVVPYSGSREETNV